ncbi:MAG TPA: helix-turn-helix domain-containing protein [Terriglobales bacterium]|nr:helix-turn-helix domain-containing protein [Terriglobales bacterium]
MVEHPTLYKVREVADHFGVTNDTVLGWVRRGRLMALRLANGHYRVTAQSFEKLLHAAPRKKAR